LECVANNMTIVYLASNFLTGVSSDTKPTNVPTNSVFAETNTLKLWLFDGANWNVIGGTSCEVKPVCTMVATAVIETTEMNPSAAALIATTVIETTEMNPSAASIVATAAWSTP